ncbi:Hypothetical_protein [Hexamita inflata]|uniref:Hypothetical_protein n=1 Tax=Hexamita inflata TaxID=28002 RepID=A0AA86TFW6_9EUKA|nr:Hypothetical protein HINF_LOCUS2717 [Hexamita inflata]
MREKTRKNVEKSAKKHANPHFRDALCLNKKRAVFYSAKSRKNAPYVEFFLQVRLVFFSLRFEFVFAFNEICCVSRFDVGYLLFKCEFYFQVLLLQLLNLVLQFFYFTGSRFVFSFLLVQNLVFENDFQNQFSLLAVNELQNALVNQFVLSLNQDVVQIFLLGPQIQF